MNSDPLNPLKTLCNCDRLSVVPQCHWPDILSARIDGESASIELKITPDLHWFDGHFPEQPVLPGVVQTHWASLLGSAVFDMVDDFSALTRLKFKTPVLPGQAMCLELSHIAARSQVNYRYFDNGTDFSTGTLHFGNPTT